MEGRVTGSVRPKSEAEIGFFRRCRHGSAAPLQAVAPANFAQTCYICGRRTKSIGCIDNEDA